MLRLMAGSSRSTRVLVETGRSKVFAAALDWPGWARGVPRRGGPEAALEALDDYRQRYAAVASAAGVGFRPPRTLDVVETVDGDTSTDFGVLSVAARADAEPWTAAEASRQVSLLRAAWAELDRLAVEAPPTLRKGPRGGGRDRDAVVEHVVGAERAYGRKIGVRHPPFDPTDASAVQALRDDLCAALPATRDGEPLAPNGWTARYAVRRMAWHVLDHVWEIEDKSDG
jgi:hypothetical protein